VDSKGECRQFNLAHVARKKYNKKKLKQTNASAQWHSVWHKLRSAKADDLILLPPLFI